MIRTPRFLIAALAVAGWHLAALPSTAEVSSRLSSRFLARGEKATLEISVTDTRPTSIPLVRTSPDVSVRLLSRDPETRLLPGRRFEHVFEYELYSYKTGDHTIPAVEVEAGGGSERTEPLEFRVFDPDILQWDEGMAGTVPFRYAATFLTLNPSPYEGETTPAEIKLYVPADLFVDDWGIPDLQRDGLTAWRFQPSRLRNEVNLLGRPFVSVSYPSTLTPTRSGDISIGPAKIRLISILAVTDFGRLRRVPVEVNVEVPELRLDAKPLPDGAPEGFENAVGEFRIATETSNTELSEGDPVPIEITVKGAGNLDSLRPPKPLVSDGWKIYDATPEQRGDERRELSGKVKFHQFLRPLQIQPAVPSFSLVYFEPKSGTYKTATSDPIPLQMSPAAAVPGSVANVPPAADVPVERMTDILGLLQPASLVVTPPRGVPGWAWHSLAALIALGLIGKALWMRCAPRLQRHPDEIARKRELRELERLQAADPKTFLMGAGRFIERWLGESPPDEARNVLAERDAACFRSDPQPSIELDAKRRGEILRTLRRAGSLALFACLCLAASPAHATETATAQATKETDTAARARAAFDEGRFDDAAALWLGAGPFDQLAADTLYNIGNACYRAGSSGEAALYYRRALLRDPRHRESLQNLRFIERKYGAISVHRPEYQDLLAKLPLGFWKGTFWTGAWLVLLAVLVFPATRPAARMRLAAVAALLAAPLLIVGGGFGWRYFPDDAAFAPVSRQAVVVAEDVVVHADAARTSPEVIDAPPGSICEVLRESGRWSYISFATQTRGWVPSSAIERVVPRKTPQPPTLRKPKADDKSA